MLIILSPAKTLDMAPGAETKGNSVPVFKAEADGLVSALKQLSVNELSQLMGISSNLARLTAERYRTWGLKSQAQTKKQAILAFRGDAYIGLDAGTMTETDLSFAQGHLRILSGLYGVLRPLDLIGAYRLEIGTKWKTAAWKNLYDFWGNRITSELNDELLKEKGSVLINLASDEYYRAVSAGRLEARVIKPVFKDEKGGDYRVVSVYSKKARGMMASYIIRNQLNDPQSIKGFEGGGYCYNDRLSTDNEWIFTR